MTITRGKTHSTANARAQPPAVATRTRSKAPFQEMLTVIKPTRTMPRKKINKISRVPVIKKDDGSREKLEHFRKVFKDPPNAAEIEDDSFIPAGYNYDYVGVKAKPEGKRFRPLQFYNSCSNCEEIFVATIFLCKGIYDMSRLEEDSFIFNLARSSPVFKDLAWQLAKIPSMQGVTAQALYQRIIEERNSLDEWIKTASGDVWQETRMSEMAALMAGMDVAIRRRDKEQRAELDEMKGHEFGQVTAGNQQHSKTTKTDTLAARVQAHLPTPTEPRIPESQVLKTPESTEDPYPPSIDYWDDPLSDINLRGESTVSSHGDDRAALKEHIEDLEERNHQLAAQVRDANALVEQLQARVERLESLYGPIGGRFDRLERSSSESHAYNGC
ncbi:hypothetical protein BGZ73_001502 [Actinomortierella ambigua]|nr:hypothetical protein BGZ73_001502 [Actinomortierella ambigua]